MGADELVFLDITASHEGRKTITELAAKVAKKIFIPFTIGGGISSVDDIRDILLAGADKVSLNTAVVKDPELISRGAEKYGSQCIVVAIDAKRRDKNDPSKGFEVYTHGGRNNTNMDVVEWAHKVVELGAGEILLTSMDRDGTKVGFDLELIKVVSTSVPVPVIASGGVGNKEHFLEAFTKGNADAALAASVFHFREYSIREVKEYLREKGVPVRVTWE